MAPSHMPAQAPAVRRVAPHQKVAARPAGDNEASSSKKRKSKKVKTAIPLEASDDLAAALLKETDQIAEKDNEELELEKELFGFGGGEGDLEGLGLGDEGKSWAGLGASAGAGFSIDTRPSTTSGRSSLSKWSDDDEAPEEFGTSAGAAAFFIDRKGNEKDKVDVKERGHVKFNYEDEEDEDAVEEEDIQEEEEDEAANEQSDEDSQPEHSDDDEDHQPSDSDSSAAPQQPTQPAIPTRKPAWQDDEESTEPVEIGSSAPARARKLRTDPNESSIPMAEYEQRLRRQFERTQGSKPEWAMTASEKAELIGVKKRARHADSSDEDEGQMDGEETIDGLFRRTGALIVGKERRGPVPKGAIGMRRMRDANWQGVSESVITSLAFHPTTPTLFTTSLDRTLRLFSIDGQANPHLQTVSFKDLPARKGAWLSKGNEVLVGGRRPYWYSFDVESGTVARILLPKESGILSTERFSVSPDGKTVAIPGASGNIHIMSAQTKRPLYSLHLSGDARDAVYGNDGKLYGLSGEGEMYLFDLSARKCMARWRDYGGQGSAGGRLAVSGDGSWIVTGNDSGLVNMYSLPTVRSLPSGGNPVPSRTLRNLTTQIYAMAFHPTSQLLLISSRQKRDALRLVHTESQTVYSNWPTQGTPLGFVQSVAWGGRRGEWLAVGESKGKCRLWGVDHFM